MKIKKVPEHVSPAHSLEQKIDHISKTLDKVVIATISLQEGQKEMQEDIASLKQHHERTFNRVDEFLRLIDRHETEIAANHSATLRIDARVEQIETALDIS